jgi:hypothetical protein
MITLIMILGTLLLSMLRIVIIFQMFVFTKVQRDRGASSCWLLEVSDIGFLGLFLIVFSDEMFECIYL